jgi:hypothetical protein
MRTKVADNIYNLVEQAALNHPRSELWRAAALALAEGNFAVVNGSELPFPKISPKTYSQWLIEFKNAIFDRGSEPEQFRHILTRVIVHVSDFNRWLRTAPSGRRGPRRGTTGLQESDRKLFPRIDELMSSGKAQSAYGAVLWLVQSGEVDKRNADEKSVAKRISALYRKEQTLPKTAETS